MLAYTFSDAHLLWKLGATLYLCKNFKITMGTIHYIEKKLTFMLLVSFPIHDHLHLYNKTLHIELYNAKNISY